MDMDAAALISAAKVRQRYGGVSHMWIERRLQDDTNFPRPIYIGRLRFWRLAALKAWELALATSLPHGGGGPPKRTSRAPAKTATAAAMATSAPGENAEV